MIPEKRKVGKVRCARRKEGETRVTALLSGGCSMPPLCVSEMAPLESLDAVSLLHNARTRREECIPFLNDQDWKQLQLLVLGHSSFG